MDTAHARYLATRRFASLDGLRALAVVPVVWHHATLGPRPGILGRGPLGVDLFFVLSGFLITTLLLREVAAHGRVATKAFYVRRALRIFPLYYLVLSLFVVHAVTWMPLGPQRTHFLHNVVYFATYTANWFVDFAVPHPVSFAFAWSLAAEEQFYLVWPWIIAVSRRVRWVPVGASLLLVVAAEASRRGLGQGLLADASLARRIAGSIPLPLCLGTLLAELLHDPRGYRIAGSVLAQPASALVSFGLLLAAAALDGVPSWVAQLAMALLVGACCVRNDHSLAWLTDAVPVRWVGTVSYGIYLIHVPVLTGLRRALPSLFASPLPAFVAALALTTGVASASFVWFERPFAGRRRRSVLTSTSNASIVALPSS